MTGVAAIAFCAAFTSCSKSEELYDAGQITKNEAAQIEENYNKAFIATFGQPAANQDWGFGSGAGTRSVIKQDMTDYPSATAPAAITTKEAEWVTDWFQKNPGLTEVGQPFTNFYVQFVSGDQNNKKGIWHRYDQNRKDENGNPDTNWDEEFQDNGGMDKLHCGATRDQSSTDHLNDFNAKTGGPWDVVYIKNGSALQWGYHSSWGEDSKAPAGDGYYWYFKMVELEVPGSCFSDGVARKGWYVGLSLYGKKYDNGDKELGYQRLQYAEDWIVKVVPGDTEPTYVDRIIAEDLNAQANNSDATDDWTVGSDWDFNDVVFDVRYEGTTAYVKIVGAGGVYPIYVAGHEAHEALGQSGPVNGLYQIQNSGTAQEFPVANITPSKHGKDIEIKVERTSSTGDPIIQVLKAEVGKPAAKIRVNPTFEPCEERRDIRDKYPHFGNWVVTPGNADAVDWQNYKK